MDIYNYLKKDHRKVSKLFKQTIAATTSKKRLQLFLEIKKELELHADPEHDTFYAALKQHSQTQEDAQHGDKEHKEIKKALAKLSKISIKSLAKWLVQFGELKHIVEHHVEDEEEKMFKDAKAVISHEEAVQLALEMDHLKETLRASKKFQKEFKGLKNAKKSRSTNK